MVRKLADFYNSTRSARKIIVVDLGFLGDSVHLIPALVELKRHYPHAELHTLSAPLGRDVLQLAPCVDRAWAFPLGAQSPPWWRHWGIIGALRREGFEVAFNFSGADRTIFLTALTGARWRVAHAGGRDHFWKTWLIRNWVPRQRRDVPVFEQRRGVLAACGFELEPARFELAVPAAARAWAAATVPERAVHFSLSASSPLKEWPLRQWVELASRLVERHPHLTVIATGSPSAREQERLRQFAAQTRSERVQVLPPGMTIAQLAALLERCEVHVGADSGVLHLAMALGVATVALFREYAGTGEWLPRGPRQRQVTVACACADVRPPPCAAGGEARCLAEISAVRVGQLVENLRTVS